MDEVLKAIGDGTRRDILNIVWRNEMPAGRIAEHFDITRPGVSQHLRVLKTAGLISERRAGTQRLYRARPEGLRELRAYFETLWDEGLERLKVAAEAEQQVIDQQADKEGRHGADRKHKPRHSEGNTHRRAS